MSATHDVLGSALVSSESWSSSTPWDAVRTRRRSPGQSSRSPEDHARAQSGSPTGRERGGSRDLRLLPNNPNRNEPLAVAEAGDDSCTDQALATAEEMEPHRAGRVATGVAVAVALATGLTAVAAYKFVKIGANGMSKAGGVGGLYWKKEDTGCANWRDLQLEPDTFSIEQNFYACLARCSTRPGCTAFTFQEGEPCGVGGACGAAEGFDRGTCMLFYIPADGSCEEALSGCLDIAYMNSPTPALHRLVQEGTGCANWPAIALNFAAGHQAKTMNAAACGNACLMEPLCTYFNWRNQPVDPGGFGECLLFTGLCDQKPDAERSLYSIRRADALIYYDFDELPEPPRTWNTDDQVSLVSQSTGCSNWDTIKIGGHSFELSESACGERCGYTSGCEFFNWQKDQGGPRNDDPLSVGVGWGACLLFREGCLQTPNFLWDLYKQKPTTALLAEPIAKGATVLLVARDSIFKIGDCVIVEGGGVRESRCHKIMGKGSLILRSGVEHDYPAGANVFTEPETTAIAVHAESTRTAPPSSATTPARTPRPALTSRPTSTAPPPPAPTQAQTQPPASTQGSTPTQPQPSPQPHTTASRTTATSTATSMGAKATDEEKTTDEAPSSTPEQAQTQPPASTQGSTPTQPQPSPQPHTTASRTTATSTATSMGAKATDEAKTTDEAPSSTPEQVTTLTDTTVTQVTTLTDTTVTTTLPEEPLQVKKGNSGHYCPAAADFQPHAGLEGATVSPVARGYTISGGASVTTRASWDLTAGFVTFDLDLSRVPTGQVDAAKFVATQTMIMIPTGRSGLDFDSELEECVGTGTRHSKEFCPELDLLGSNGRSAWSTGWRLSDGSDPSVACRANEDEDGKYGGRATCRAERLFKTDISPECACPVSEADECDMKDPTPVINSSTQFRVNATFDTGGVTVTLMQSGAESQQVVKTADLTRGSEGFPTIAVVTQLDFFFKHFGAALTSSVLASDWVPGLSDDMATHYCNPDPKKNPLPAAELTSAELTVSNLMIFGKLVHGTSDTCKQSEIDAMTAPIS